jgi:hypothetical protein
MMNLTLEFVRLVPAIVRFQILPHQLIGVAIR